MKVGILAVQGAVQPHVEKLKSLKVEPVLVRTPEALSQISGIILPGGESSAMIHLLKLTRLWDPLKEFVQMKPAWGVCAGVILLAKDVSHPVQESLDAIDISVTRNAYGRQNESFIDQVKPTERWPDKNLVEGVFIRAPRITRMGSNVKTLLTHREDAVLVEENNILATTFHPELTESASLHKYFIEKCVR
jgi:pyridoxal 5'-phosphate synthase pdxT subunit